MASSASDLPGTLVSLQISAKGLKKKEMRCQLENEVFSSSHLLPEYGRRLSRDEMLLLLECHRGENGQHPHGAGKSPLGVCFPQLQSEGIVDQVIRNVCLELYKWIFITIFAFLSFNVTDYFTCSITYMTYPQKQTQPKCPSVEDNMVHVYSH